MFFSGLALSQKLKILEPEKLHRLHVFACFDDKSGRFRNLNSQPMTLMRVVVTEVKKVQVCRVLVCDCACVHHTRACGNLGAKEVRSFMDLCVRMCVHAGFFGCVTRVRSHLKFFNKIMKKRLKTKGFQWPSKILTFT